MPIARFDLARLFVEPPLHAGLTRALDSQQLNYLRNVLRFADGDVLLIFDGVSGEWLARCRFHGRREGMLEIGEPVRPQERPGDLWYLFAPLKSARLDYMVQKAVEMGVSRLQPVITARTQVSRVNLERMRANVIEACEQCGVLNVPEVSEPVPLASLLAAWEGERRLLFCDEALDGGDPHGVLLRLAPAPLAVLIGPEGGFTDEERQAIKRHPAALALSLGPRILRADTAAVAALAIVQSALGDWRNTQA